MSRIVAGLERIGLVARRDDPDDGRVVLLHATRTGARLLDRARRHRVADLARRLGRLSAREREVIASAVDLLQELTH